MAPELTREFVDAVELPRNPLKRHLAVVAILRDPEIARPDVVRETGTYPLVVFSESGKTTRTHLTGFALFGRRTLKMIIRDREELNRREEDYGEDF